MTRVKRGGPSTKKQGNESSAQRTHRMLTRALSLECTRNAVFNTAELLHSILIELPVEDLVVARGVSKHWHEMIMTSRPIRKVMFLEAEPKPKHEWVCNPEAGTLVTSDTTKEHPKPTHGTQYKSIPSVLNPYLFSLGPAHLRPDLISRANICEPVEFRLAPAINVDFFFSSSSQGHHSRKLAYGMYVTQPPVGLVEISVMLTPRKSARKPPTPIRLRVAAAKGKPGVRFADLLVAICNRVRAPMMKRYKIDVATKDGVPGTVMWMVGGVFADGEEKMLVESGKLSGAGHKDDGDE